MYRYGLEIKVNDQEVSREGFEKDYYVLSCKINSILRKEDEEEYLQ
jgi:molybdopterin converting factor small subunit